MKPVVWLFCAGLLLGTMPTAQGGEICGNKVDDDGNDLTDEGCYAPLRTGLCESPLSCTDTGWVSWSTGSLHYSLPPDVAPKSPYGPDIGLQRFYTSMYSPPSTPSSVNRSPLGTRWQHNYMSWIDPTADAGFVIHTPQGDDLLAYPGGEGDTSFHALQPGKGPYAWLRERWNAAAGAIEYELRTKTGEALIYNNAGQLVEIRDTVAPPNTNKVLLTWTSTGSGWAVSTVTDATKKRRLSFSYTGSLLTEVHLELATGGSPTTPPTWTTFHTTTYLYAAGNLARVTIGGQLAQTNVYTGGLLTQINDGGGTQIVAFKYSATTPGETHLVDTEDGTLGFAFGSPRASCQTVLYFNKGNANSCSSDGDCGSGLLCSAKAGSGETGSCFRAARCLTLDPASDEGLVTSVRALGPGSEPCTGACAEVTQYLWNTAGALDLKATGDALGSFTTVKYDVNGNGMPTQINYADTDRDPENGGTRTVYFTYDGNHPGRITQVRRATNFGTQDCSDPTLRGCAETLYEYDPATGKLSRTIQNGMTLDGAGELAGFSYTTTRTYDAQGRLTSIDGPLNGPGEYDITTYSYYHGSDDPLREGFLSSRTRQVSEDSVLTEYINRYDHWGNATDWLDVDGTRSCRTYDPARNYLAKTSEEMGGPADSSCASPHPSDIIESYTRDSALRLTQAQSGDGSCVFYEYDGKGRLARTKRRDGCEASSPGDREEYVYDHDGLLTEVDTYNAAGVVTRKVLASYHDSRRPQAIPNPVDATKLQAFSYDARGVLTAIDDEAGLGRTTFSLDTDYRTTSITQTRNSTTTTPDPWTILPDSQGQPSSVTDPDGRVLETTYDDLGRLVRVVPPDQNAISRYSYTPHGEVWRSADAMEAREFIYDSLGRLLWERHERGCPSGMPQIINYWDANPFCTIPGGCQNLMGRLAGTRVILMCDRTLVGGELAQWTSYSYDAAGRVIAEHISDNSGRPNAAVLQTYAWTKGGELAQVTLPSSAVLGWTYGSAASNSDSDVLTGQWRTSPATPVTANIQWNPYGPLKQYDRMDVISASRLRMRFEYNLAYRLKSLALEGQTFGGPYYRLALAEDAKGRITKRDYYPSDPQMTGVFDSYFLYDHQDHVLCETTSPVTSCPSTASDIIKNSYPDGLTGAGDRTTLLRPIPGSTSGMTNVFGIAPGGHRITRVDQSWLGRTSYWYDARSSSNRSRESNASPQASHAARSYVYDTRGNVGSVRGSYLIDDQWHDYVMRSAFDARNRRVFKSFEDQDQVPRKQKQWFFYYDPLDRLTEVRYVPDSSMSSVFTTYQLFWLEDLLTAYWQTESPSGNTTKRYVESDETGRPVRMHSWETGNSRVVWAINPDAWGVDRTVIGQDVYQPILFAGQYQDAETATFLNDRVTMHRPGLVLNGARTYDPFTGSYLQLDPLVDETWSAYAYADGNPVGEDDPMGLSSQICRPVATSIRIPVPGSWSEEVIFIRQECWDTGPGGHTGGGIQARGRGVSKRAIRPTTKKKNTRPAPPKKSSPPPKKKKSKKQRPHTTFPPGSTGDDSNAPPESCEDLRDAAVRASSQFLGGIEARSSVWDWLVWEIARQTPDLFPYFECLQKRK